MDKKAALLRAQECFKEAKTGVFDGIPLLGSGGIAGAARNLSLREAHGLMTQFDISPDEIGPDFTTKSGK